MPVVRSPEAVVWQVPMPPTLVNAPGLAALGIRGLPLLPQGVRLRGSCSQVGAGGSVASGITIIIMNEQRHNHNNYQIFPSTEAPPLVFGGVGPVGPVGGPIVLALAHDGLA